MTHEELWTLVDTAARKVQDDGMNTLNATDETCYRIECTLRQSIVTDEGLRVTWRMGPTDRAELVVAAFGMEILW